MPFFFEPQLGTSVNVDSDTPKLFPSTNTSARKFNAVDMSAEQEHRDVDVVSNSEHLIEQAAGMKGVAMVAEQIAESARLSLSVTRERLSNVVGASKSDVRQAPPNITEIDLSYQRNLDARNLVLNFSPGLIDLNRISSDVFNRLPSFVFHEKLSNVAPHTFNPAVPQLDNVHVEMNKKRGTVDCFFTTLQFSLPLSQVWDGKIKAVRIFRATIFHPTFQRGSPPVITIHGMEKLSVDKMRSRSKSHDLLGAMENRFREAGVFNSLSVLNPIDPETNRRLSTDVTNAQSQPEDNSGHSKANTPRGQTELESFISSDKFSEIDTNVAKDLNVIRNIKNQNLGGGSIVPQSAITVKVFSSPKSGLFNREQVLASRGAGNISLSVDENNFSEFRDIAVVSLDKLKSSILGDHVEYRFDDESVGYGKAYKYFILSVDKDMVESIRSQIVEVTVEGIRIPERPKRVFAYNVDTAVAMNIIVDDQLVEKFEIYRKSQDTTKIRNTKIVSLDISDTKGFNSSFSISRRLKNDFIKIGESLNGTRGTGASFYDRRVSPGLKYLYRVFSVDVFGNKSESPYEFEMFLPDHKKTNELLKPSLTVEVDSLSGKTKISFRCADLRVSNLFLSRRDLTIKQHAFTTPGQVNRIIFGNPDIGHGLLKFEDTVLRGDNKDSIWNGNFSNTGAETVFVDSTVSLDHVYQYQIYGVDKFGNSTSYEVSKPLMVIRRPLIDAPVNLIAEVIQGPSFTVGGVRLSWQDGNVDVPAEDSLGSRAALSNSSVRTVYQIERKRVGEERWIEFPMIEGREFFDPSQTTATTSKRPNLEEVVHPRFRPPYVETHQSYTYRVKALQKGTFQSNYSNYVEIFAVLPVVPPVNFKLKASNTKVSPFYIALNWDTPKNSGVVDRWEVERAEVNNFAAARLNIRNPADFKLLKFKPFRKIAHEASRFQASGIDSQRKNISAQPGFSSPPSLFTGDHQFQDTKVRFGNTFFYRIRSIAIDGDVSSWIYGGIKLTEESFERKIVPLISPELKRELTKTFVPLIVPPHPRDRSLEVINTSFSFQPTFSAPEKIPELVIADLPFSPLSTTELRVPASLPTYRSPAAGYPPLSEEFTAQRSAVLGSKFNIPALPVSSFVETLSFLEATPAPALTRIFDTQRTRLPTQDLAPALQPSLNIGISRRTL